MFQISFNSFDHNFCESLIYSIDPHPEYFNAISSLFITFIGINAFFMPNINFNSQMLYSSLTINGISSFFYHWFNTIGWGLLDRMSMIVIAMYSTSLFIINLNKFFKVNQLFVHLLVGCYFISLLTVAGLHMEDLFNLMFGMFLASLFIFMMIVNKHKHNLKIPTQIINFGWLGIKYIFISGLFWIVTENLCTKFSLIKYLFGHVWWHIFVSYGGYLVSLVFNYLLMIEDQQFITISYNRFGIPYLNKYKHSV